MFARLMVREIAAGNDTREGLRQACQAAGMTEDREAFFEQRIRPVLVERCYTCHSAVADPLKGALRLDSAAALAAGGASGLPAVAPGAPETSRLMEAIRYQNPDLQKWNHLDNAQLQEQNIHQALQFFLEKK